MVRQIGSEQRERETDRQTETKWTNTSRVN